MLTPIRYNNFEGLLNAGVSDFLLSDNELTACKNVWVYQIGKLQKVPGYSKATSTQLSSAVLYLHHYTDAINSDDYLLAVSNSGSNLTISQRQEGTYSTVSGIGSSLNGFANARVSMLNYLSKTFMVGCKGDSDFLPSAIIEGNTYSTSDANLTDMPKAKYIVNYKNTIFIGNCEVGGTRYPSRVYYSEPPVAGQISWDVLNDFLVFGVEDGDEITGMGVAVDNLIVFKRYSMWRYDDSSKSMMKIANIGCDNHNSIKEIAGTLYWSNRKGVYRWRGSYPELVSAKAQRYFDRVDQTTLSNQVAVLFNEDEYRIFIGDITIDNLFYENTWFCWNTVREQCYIRCTIHKANSACDYIEGGKRRAYFGTSNGYTMKFAMPADEVFSDDENEIDSFFITRAFDHGVPEQIKFTSSLIVFSNYATGMKCAIEKDNSKVFSEANLPLLRKNVEYKDLTGEAHRFRYKFYEKGDGRPWEFEGFVVLTQIKEDVKRVNL